MPRTNEENVAPKSFLSPILRFIREISVPAFLAFLGWIFSQSLAKQSAELQESLAKQSTELQESLARQSAELQRATTQQSIGKDYVGIAVSILEKPKDEEHNALRDWAVNLLVRYSPEPFSPKAQDQLESGGLARLGRGEFGPGDNFVARSLSPDRKTAALIWLTSHDNGSGGPWLKLYDSVTGRIIHQFPDFAGSGGGSPTLVWSQDGSKLLVGWSSGSVAAFDVAQKKSLGEYLAKGPGGGIESLNFSGDGRSVSIKRVEGKSEVWQLP